MRARGLGPGLTIRRGIDRPRTHSDWLDSRHTFAFGTYDRVWNGLGALKVLNEDVIAPGRGFGLHPHWDMEILTLVLEGTLEHEDSSGVRQRVGAGEAQLMSAGKGVEHGERNASPTAPLWLLQVWIEPDAKGHAVRHLHLPAREGRWRCVVAPDGRDGAMPIHQDVAVWWGELGPDEALGHAVGASRRIWLQVAQGSVEAALASAAARLDAGDGAAWIGAGGGAPLELRAGAEGARVVLFDLA